MAPCNDALTAPVLTPRPAPRCQVQQFSNKSVDMSLRVASLDYLGIVAARLRKDAVSSRLNERVITDIIDQVSVSSQTSSTNVSVSSHTSSTRCIDQVHQPGASRYRGTTRYRLSNFQGMEVSTDDWMIHFVTLFQDTRAN